MTELASRTALGGVVGDTHLGQEIHRVYADGEYDWVALKAGKAISKDLAVYSVPETGPAEPFTDGAQGTGSFISSTSGVVPTYTPDIDKTVTSIDYTLRSNTAGAAAGRFLVVRTGGPTGPVVASNAATVFTIPGNTTLNGTAILSAPLNMTAGTTYFVTLEAPAGLLGFFALGDTDPQLGFSNGSAADPALAFNGTQAGSLPFNVSFVTDGVTERYEAVDQADPTRIVRGDMPLPVTWTLVETDSSAKNVLVYPVGNFTALAVNDSGSGADGAVYKLPTVDALQITLPAKADMNAAEGIYRVRISGDWDALSTQTTVLSFTDDTANGVDMGTGLPDDGNEWLDLVFDAANDKWIATSGGDVTLALGAPPATLVERVVAIKNPGFGTIIGDFNFMMPGGGNRSIQIRTVSGTIAYTDFNTYWSAGAGGTNDAPLSGNWDEPWRYAANVNMTAHNQYQHVEFIANGWFYHGHMVVGPAYNNNRFTLTRWRVA